MTKIEICNEAIDKIYKSNELLEEAKSKLKDNIIDALKEITENDLGYLFYKEEPDDEIFNNDTKEYERLENDEKKLEKFIDINRNKLKGKYLFISHEYPKNSSEYYTLRETIEINILGKPYEFYIEKFNYHGTTNSYCSLKIDFRLFGIPKSLKLAHQKMFGYRFGIKTDKQTVEDVEFVYPDDRFKVEFDHEFRGFDKFIDGYKHFIKTQINLKNNVKPFE